MMACLSFSAPCKASAALLIQPLQSTRDLALKSSPKFKKLPSTSMNNGQRLASYRDLAPIQSHYWRKRRLWGLISPGSRKDESAPITVIAFTACAASAWESEELDERSHALFLTAARKSLGS